MKMTRLIQIGVAAFMAVALGCTTSDIKGFSIYGVKFVIGNPDDTCDFEHPSQHSVFQPGKSVPQNATPLGTIWDAEADVDTVRRIQGNCWRMDRMVYYEGYFFLWDISQAKRWLDA